MCDIGVTYLDTGGAAQNASMTSLQMKPSQDVTFGKEKPNGILKSWPFLVGLTNIQQKKPTGKIGSYGYQKHSIACTLPHQPYYQAKIGLMLSLPELRAL